LKRLVIMAKTKPWPLHIAFYSDDTQFRRSASLEAETHLREIF
jgi:hypothetical protein